MPSTVSAITNGFIGGLGTIVRDELLFVDGFPTADSKTTAVAYQPQVGGPVPTALAQLAKLGYTTEFLGCWGNDLIGDAIEADLRRARIGFDRSDCRRLDRSGFAQIWVDAARGTRAVVAVPPDGVPVESAAIEFGRRARWLHTDGWGGPAVMAAAEATVAAGGIVSLDTGSPKPTTERLLRLARVVNAPRHFFREFFGTNDVANGVRQLREMGPWLVTVTDGPAGAGIWVDDFALWLDAPHLPVVDTCGAGDIFCGGLIDGVLNGLEPSDILRGAMGTACWKIGRTGNRDALCDRAELTDFVRLHLT